MKSTTGCADQFFGEMKERGRKGVAGTNKAVSYLHNKDHSKVHDICQCRSRD